MRIYKTETKAHKISAKEPRPKSAVIIDCDTWRVIGPATKEDIREAKLRIIQRIKNAFWL